MAIACVYCGGAHDTASGVRDCWQRDHSGLAAASSEVAPSGDRRTARAAHAVDPIRAAGPDVLGRHLVVGDDETTVPAPWRGAPVVRLEAEALAEPSPLLALLRAAAHERQRLVISCLIDADALPGASEVRPPYDLGPTFSFPLDEVHHLVFANAIDARDRSRPRLPMLDRALALGGRPVDEGPGDVVLPDGLPVWLDGGPITFRPPIDGAAVLPAIALEHDSLRPPHTNVNAAALAEDQLAAVTHTGGAARIVAPAGSGKTRVLTERARHLLANWRLPAEALSLVAFNKRAQAEMADRTADLPGLQVRTLNAIALAIVNGTPPMAPQARRWRTLAEPEVRSILSRLIQFPRKRNADPVAPWLEALSAIRLGLRPPTRVEADFGGDVDGLATVWPGFRAALEREQAVDFDDQIYRAIEILTSQPVARAAAQRASRLLLVDEFQDLTPAHLLLVRLLSSPGGNVFGVGDDDQTIYGYNGAVPTWLIDFATLFPGSGDHPLTVNYRCPAGVVEAADRLLRHNRRRVPKVIRAASDDPTSVAVRDDDDPVAATIEVVSSALADGALPSHIAVLTRVNSLLAPVQAALAGRDVPLAGGVGVEFTSRTSVRAVLAWLRLAGASGGDRFDPADLREAQRRPSRALHPRIADWVAEQTDVDGLRRLATRLSNERDARTVDSFAGDIARLQRMAGAGGDTETLVRALIDDIGLARSVATLDVLRHGTNRPAQGDDLLAIAQLARLQPDPARFEQWLAHQLVVERHGDGVVLATVHRVKGQEWPVIVVHGAGVEQFPHRLADDIEEERRLFHVAITRTSRSVTVVTGEHPSPFVAELSNEPPARRADDQAPAVAGRRRSATTPRQAPDDPLLDRSTVVVGVGMGLVDGGQEWRVETVDDDGALARRGAATRRFAAGSSITTSGRQRGALRVGAGDPLASRVAAAYDELRVLRDRLRDGRPAYVVFDDKTLVAIARALPASLDGLATVKGVGPAKLEQYGDDVLGVISSVAGDPTA